MLPGTRYAIRTSTSQRVRTHSYINTYCTGDPLVPLHTLYYRTYIVHGTSWYQPESTSWYQPEISVPAWTSPWQLEHASPPSSKNLKRLWTREEVSGDANKGPPQMLPGSKSVVLPWRSRDKAQCTHKYTSTPTHQGSNEDRDRRLQVVKLLTAFKRSNS